MDGDRFISTRNNKPLHNFSEEEKNFFMQGDLPIHNLSQTEPIRRLNDYDSNILKVDAYKEVSDEIFKLEYKISRIEEELAEVDKQAQMAEEIKDYYLLDTLNSKKIQLKEDLSILNEIYKEASFSAKISGGVTSKIRDRIFNAGKIIGNLGEALISKLPGKISSWIEIKNSLNKLENINKSVDELMKSRYPYGEAVEKYEQLSKYIARANSIQSEIYKFIK